MKKPKIHPEFQADLDKARAAVVWENGEPWNMTRIKGANAAKGGYYFSPSTK